MILLSRSVQNQFPKSVQTRGYEYFQDYLCELVDMTDRGAEFEVFGSEPEPYDVSVEFGQNGIGSYECSCPYFSQHGNCKHVWGAILELDDIQEERMTPEKALAEHDERRSERLLYESSVKVPRAIAKIWEGKPGGKLLGGGNGKPGKETKPKWTSQLTPLTVEASRVPSIDTIAMAQRQEHAFVLDLQLSQSTSSTFIEFLIRERLASGAFGKWKSHSVSTNALSQNVHDRTGRTPNEELIRDLVLSRESEPTGSSYSSYWSPAIKNVSLKRSSAIPVLRGLCETGAFMWALSMESPVEDRQAIEWDEGPDWEIRFVVESRAKEKEWVISGELFRAGGDEGLPLDRPALVLPGMVVLHENRMSRCGSGEYRDWINALRRHSSLSVPFADRERFLKLLYESGAASSADRLRLPPDLRMTEIRHPPVPKLIARKWVNNHKSSQILGEVRFDYQGTEVVCDDPRPTVAVPEGGAVLRRDLEAEGEQLRKLFELPGIQRYYDKYGSYTWDRSIPKGAHHVQFAEQQLLRVVESLSAAGWSCELDGKTIRKPGAMNLEITSGIDWFDLEVSADFEGVGVGLPELLAAVRSGSKFVKLSDGTHGTISPDWMEQLKRLSGMGEIAEGKLRYSQVQALMLDAMLATREDAVRTDRKFGQLRKKLREFEGIKPADQPASFQGELRDYQKFGLGWLRFLHEFGFGGCLADDMGLGKTIQVLAFLESRRKRKRKAEELRKPTLIVVPKSLIFNWLDEGAKFCPKLKMAAYHGRERGEVLKRLGEYDVVLTTYGTLRLDIERLQKVKFDYAILDEAQAVKNPQSLSNKAVRVIDADYRLALTGTPIENHLGELWALFEFLNPGLLGRSENFKELTKSLRDDPANLSILSAGIRPYLLRRTKEQVLTELPEKTEQTLYCELSPKERKQYDELKEYYRQKLLGHVEKNGMAKSQIYILEALLRLRQAACHPGLVKESLKKLPSAKLETLLEQLQEVLAEGHKVLVFSQFTTLLGIVKEQLDKLSIRYEYLDGKTTKRKETVSRFQTTDDCPVFLLSLKAGGVGLNLTAADYVFILDPWWNPAVEKQAVDRAHRIGQTNRVFAYRLIARETVEEKILTLQQQKKELADSIITADSSLMQTLTVEDLNLLLS